MRRHLWLVTMVGICFLAAGSVVGQQSSSPEKLRASGEHTSFEWLFLPIRTCLLDFTVHRLHPKLAFDRLGESQTTNRDCPRPASNSLRWSDPTLAFFSKPRLRSDESIRGKVILMLTSAENEITILRPEGGTDMSTANRHLLSRRQFSVRCASFGLSLPAVSALLAVSRSARILAATGAASEAAARTVRFPDGITVPALGQGAWHLGQGRHPVAVEEEAMRTGISLGMTLIDTSGNYGNGRSEQFIGHAIAGQRGRIFLVSKVEADEVSGDGIARACKASLARLGTDYLDLYLLHSPVPRTQLAGVVAAFEKLRAAGKIRAWGVSNFDMGQMEDLFRVPDGTRCATNQVAYSLKNRGIERDVLPWCTQHNMPVMAYSPLGGDNNLLVTDRTLAQIGAAHECSAAAVALAWVIRSGKVIAIPEAGSPAHAREDAAALSIALTPQDLQTLAAAYPGP
jgi:diketogulonate reductase-like aldo/keto reductase